MSPKRTGGAATPAIQELRRAGVDFTEHRYDHDPAVTDFGAEAAAALAVNPDRVLKTLLVDDGHDLAVAIVSVAAHLDLKAVAAAVGVKRVTMADPHAAEKATGYVVGGISPFGRRRTLRSVLDEHALVHGTILVSGGRRGLELEVAPLDLARVTGSSIAPIARSRHQEDT